MKKLYILFLLFTMPAAIAQQWNWVTGHENATGNDGELVSVDAQGNTYSFGTFQSDIITSQYELHNVNPQNIDSYIIKYNVQGQFQWVKHIGGMGQDVVRAIDNDAAGNSFVTGTYSNGITFSNQSFTGAGAYVAKYNTNGDFLWVKTFTISSPYTIKITENGNIYVAGVSANDIVYDSVTLTNTPTGNTQTGFLLKLEGNGDIIWGRVADSNNTTFGIGVYDIDVDASGNVYMGGTFSNYIVSFGNDISLVSAQSSNTFIVKYNSNGVAQWAKHGGNNSCTNYVTNVAVDAQGNVFATGSFCGNITFDTTQLSSPSGARFFILKYNSSGNLLWAKTAASGGLSSIIRSADVDVNGALLVSGNYNGPLNLGNSVGLTNAITAQFVAMYTDNGVPVWIIGTSTIDVNNALTIECWGTNTVFTGSYVINQPVMTFGNLSYTKTGSNYYNTVVGKMEYTPLGIKSYTDTSVSVYPNPIEDVLNVQSLATVQEIIITDCNGRTITQAKDTATIATDALAKGVYMLIITTDTGTTKRKIIK